MSKKRPARRRAPEPRGTMIDAIRRITVYAKNVATKPGAEGSWTPSWWATATEYFSLAASIIGFIVGAVDDVGNAFTGLAPTGMITAFDIGSEDVIVDTAVAGRLPEAELTSWGLQGVAYTQFQRAYLDKIEFLIIPQAQTSERSGELIFATEQLDWYSAVLDGGKFKHKGETIDSIESLRMMPGSVTRPMDKPFRYTCKIKNPQELKIGVSGNVLEGYKTSKDYPMDIRQFGSSDGLSIVSTLGGQPILRVWICYQSYGELTETGSDVDDFSRCAITIEMRAKVRLFGATSCIEVEEVGGKTVINMSTLSLIRMRPIAHEAGNTLHQTSSSKLRKVTDVGLFPKHLPITKVHTGSGWVDVQPAQAAFEMVDHPS